MIFYTTPFNTDLNIGQYYNDFMSLVGDDDYVCFLDGDVIFTTSDYGHIIDAVVKKNPDVDCFTCYTNRVNCKWQVHPDCDTESDDYTYHRQFGEKLRDKYGTDTDDCTNKQLFSGMMFVIKKSSYNKIGGAKTKGMLGVDNDIHIKLKRNGMKLHLMKGVYVYHWHRGSCFNLDSKHLSTKQVAYNNNIIHEPVKKTKPNTDGLSVIVCYNDERKLGLLKASLQQVNVPNLEFLSHNNINNENLPCVYNRLSEFARYENLLLVHQDVEFKDSNFNKILDKLSEESCGCIGFAGSRVRVKAVTTWNQIPEYNATNYYDGSFDKLNRTNFYKDDFVSVVDLDGFALFTKKSVVKKCPFDTINTGFHGYDLDFTLSLKKNGLNNYVYTNEDVKAMHRSTGSYNKDWFKTIIHLTHTKWDDILPIRTSDVTLADFNTKVKNSSTQIEDLFNRRLQKLSFGERKEVIKYNADHVSGKYKKVAKPENIVVYTCITGGYDKLVEPKVVTPGVDYICFTDDSTLMSDIWKMRPIPNELKELSNVKQQRLVKTSPHKYLKAYDISIWVDGSVDVTGDIHKVLDIIKNSGKWSGSEIFIPVHPRRNCIYDEASACIRMKKDTKENVDAQMERYRNEGFPKQFGLPQSNIIIRKHNSARCVTVMDTWSDEIRKGSHRDQLSFNYALWKNGITNVCYLNKDFCKSEFFNWNSIHKKSADTQRKMKTTVKCVGETASIVNNI